MAYKNYGGRILKMKKAIIVGASSGIGKELAELLVKNGFKVAITGRRLDLLEQIYMKHPQHIYYRNYDATDLSISIQRLEELTLELGGLDLFIFCSGTGELNEKLDFKIEKKTIDLNVTGFTNSINWAYTYFENKGLGHLITITSIAGLRGNRHAPAYNATKAYQINYLEGLRQKATKNKKEIAITDIRPGFVDTAMAKGEGLFWVMPANKVAKQILSAINKKKKVVYVTKRWWFVAWIIKVLPSFIYEKL